MTIEEIQYKAQGIMQEWGSNDSAPYVEFVEKLASMELPEPPSNLDEAAEEWCKTNNKGIALSADKKSHYLAEGKDAFKAGAEWMAGQGVTVDGIFKAGDPGYPDVRMGEQYSIEHILCKPGGIKPGDEVIVQIRKKQ